jgi:hypothetical protein
MATVTKQAIVWTTAAGAKTTAAFVPANNDLLVVFETHAAVDAASTISDSLGGAWTSIGTAQSWSTAVAGQIRCWVRNSLVNGSSMTVTSTPGGTSTGGGLAVFSITGNGGLTGSSAVVQSSGQADQAAGTPAPVLGSAASAGNALLGCVVTNSNVTTNTAPPTSWTEDYDQGYTSPGSGIEACHRDSGETNTTITWGAATPSQFGSFVVEFSAPANITVSAPVAAATGAGNVPTGIWTAILSVAAATADALVPTIVIPGGGITVSPGVAVATGTGLAPTVILTVLPAAGAATGAALAPTIREAVLPSVAVGAASGLVPTLRETVLPGVAVGTAAGLVPTLREAALPGVAIATASGLVPTIIIPGASITITPGVAGAVALGLAPTIRITLLAGMGTATASALVPAVLIPIVIFPGVATASAEGLAPTVIFLGARVPLIISETSTVTGGALSGVQTIISETGSLAGFGSENFNSLGVGFDDPAWLFDAAGTLASGHQVIISETG